MYLLYLLPVIPGVTVHLFPITLSNFMQQNETMWTWCVCFFSPGFHHELTGSQGFHGENSYVMDCNWRRQRTGLSHWKCKISCIHFCRWLPNYTLAVHVTCHLTTSVILAAQYPLPYRYFVTQLCKSNAPLAQLSWPYDNMGCTPLLLLQGLLRAPT